ncbi:MAG: PQQ-binding-like beta-propeller repeat protein [Actinomycetota bacterium]
MRLDRRELMLGGAALLLSAESRSHAAGGQNWSNWRGPHFNGSSDEKNLPVKFSPTEGVRWSVPMPGPSAATPIIWGNSVFVSSVDIEAKQLLAICLNRNTGAVRWKHAVGSGYLPGGQGNEIQLEPKTNYASPSPVTDGQRVIFFYGNGDLIALDFAGKTLWSRNLQKELGDFGFSFTFSTSPLLYEGRLYMQVLQRNRPIGSRGKEGAESYLMALDPATGKEQWRVVRPAPAVAESLEAYSTPVPFVYKGRKEILIAGGDILTGHDPATGRELWRWGTYNQDPDDPNSKHKRSDFRLVPSPVAGGGVVLACSPKTKPVFAVKAGQAGDVTQSGLAWHSEIRSVVTSDVPTPLFYRDRFYVASDLKKALSCLDPKDGKVLWTVPTPSRSAVWASPTAGDGKIYAMSLQGEVSVFHADSGELLSTNAMAPEENEIRSGVAIAGGNLFIRTNSRLYCIEKA